MTFGNKHLEVLVDNINHGGAWENPVLVKILSRQSIDSDEGKDNEHTYIVGLVIILNIYNFKDYVALFIFFSSS